MAMRDVSRPVQIRVVLLLDDPKPFGDAAWQAISDAAALFDVDGGRIEVSEYGSSEVRLATRVEPTYLGRGEVSGAWPALPSERVVELLRLVEARNPSVKETPRRGSPGNAVADPMALVAYVGDAVGASGSCVVVHDRPLQPPAGLRYVIWNPVPGGVAVSFATLDPWYWGERLDDVARRETVRRRLRAALCSVLGTAIGLVRCANPTCFLFANVDRVTALDAMVRIGEEHGAPALTGRGFTSAGDDPALPAQIVLVDDRMDGPQQA